LRASALVLGLLWLDDEQASFHFDTMRVFTLMDGTTLETQIEERQPECLLMSSGKIQKLVRKTRRSKGRNPGIHVIIQQDTIDYATSLFSTDSRATGAGLAIHLFGVLLLLR
jgi:hypothetical protein